MFFPDSPVVAPVYVCVCVSVGLSVSLQALTSVESSDNLKLPVPGHSSTSTSSSSSSSLRADMVVLLPPVPTACSTVTGIIQLVPLVVEAL